MSPGRWLSLAAAVGFATPATFSSWLQLERNAFVFAYSVVAGTFLAAYVVTTGLHPPVQLRRRWRAGLVAGLLIGAWLAHGVTAQPASSRPEGLALVGALSWLGVVYGTLDALLLTGAPVLIVYAGRPVELLRRRGPRARWGGLALFASLAVTAAYHLGFAEFRGPALIQPLIGNGVITVGYLLTGSLLAPVLAHVIMHAAAVLHGMATTVQLPPHY